MQKLSKTPSLTGALLLAAVATLAASYRSSAHASSQATESQNSVPVLGKIGQFITDAPDSALNPFGRQWRDVRNKTYQLGDDWGKKAVTDDVLNYETPQFRRAAKATARTGGATGFFLGEFGGSLVIATNHHVFPEARSCLQETIRFPLLKINATCTRYLGTWESVDLSLFVVELQRPEQREALLAVGSNFDFASPITQAQELLTIGFGIANNPQQQLVANRDGDCKVFSPNQSFKLMPDPDALNPGTYDAWSFANGCDVSHGDSGSAMVDRKTGRPIGLIWTGKIPKNPKVQESQYLNEILQNQSPEIWTELSYAVPAAKIRDVLEAASKDSSTDSQDRKIFAALIAN